MRNRKQLNIITILVALNFFIFSPSSTYAQDYYVSPSGSDDASGSTSNPLQTVQFAIQKASTSLSENVTIYLREGIYYLPQTINIGPANWPTTKGTLRIQSYPSEKVVISGGKIITGSWNKISNIIWEKDVSTYLDPQGDIRQVFYNNQRISRSRFPSYASQDLLDIESIDPAFTAISFSNYKNQLPTLGSNAELITVFKWIHSIIPINNAHQGWLGLRGRVWFEAGWTIQPDADVGFAYIENIPLEQSPDTTSLWEYDKKNQKLRVKLALGEHPDNHIIIPQLDNIIRINNASNIVIDGITFKHARGWVMPQLQSIVDDGYKVSCNDLCYYDTQSGQHVVFDSANLNSFKMFEGAISLTNSTNIILSNNEISQSGGIGLSIHEGNNQITAEYNSISDIGSNCVNIGTQLKNDNFSHHIIFKNNIINNCGVINPSGVGIWEGFSRNVEIAHNQISNLPYSGISWGWDWGNRTPHTSTNRFNNIHNNRIFDICKKLIDCGGIYTVGPNQDSTISHNLIYDIRVHPQMRQFNNPINIPFNSLVAGIYFDNCSAGFNVFNNIVYGIPRPELAMFFQDSAGSESFLNQFTIGTNYLNISEHEAWNPGDLANNTGPAIKVSATRPTLKPGDINGDGHVNLHDYNDLVKDFGSKYTLFDYNNLVANYEQ